jgi:hypothetical protein
MNSPRLAPLVGDLRQLASVRRVVLDEGQEAGVRALLFSTGGGLDFMVLADRALDIGTLSYRGVPLAWQGPTGFTHPGLIERDAEGGTGMHRGFSGAMITCGLDHIRQPAGGQPLHGRFPFTPARLLAHGEDWDRAEPVLFCEGEIVQSSRGHEVLKLRRRIEAPVGGTTIRVIDSVENCGPGPTPHNLLYHINFGFPAIGQGTRVLLSGETVEEIASLADPAAQPKVRCLAAGREPTSTCELVTGSGVGATRIALGFSAESLPYLQVWTDLRPRASILAIEPCTSERTPEGRSGGSVALDVGERRDYRLEFSITGEAPSFSA